MGRRHGFWKAEGGLLVGESTAAKPLPANTFLIWTKAQPADFELKLDFRITAGNTGVQYRSQRAPDIGPFVLKGYQADIDFANQWTGQLYEERGRAFLALPGQATSIGGDKPRIFGSVTPADALKAAINVGGWNTIHIIARKESGRPRGERQGSGRVPRRRRGQAAGRRLHRPAAAHRAADAGRVPERRDSTVLK